MGYWSQYQSQNFPYLKIRELTGILDNTDNFQVRWGNERKLPYDGWVEVEVSLKKESPNSVTVPFLVTSENLEYAILETNVIEHLSAPYIRMSCNISYQDLYQTIHQKYLTH